MDVQNPIQKTLCWPQFPHTLQEHSEDPKIRNISSPEVRFFALESLRVVSICMMAT